MTAGYDTDSRVSRGAGFTLVEMLVAIAILAIIAVLGWRGLDGIVRARDAVSAETAFQRGLQAAFAQIESDLRQVTRDPSDTTTLPGILFGQGAFAVLRQAPVATDGRLRYQLVRYEVQSVSLPDGGLSGRLLRRVVTVETPEDVTNLLKRPEWPNALEQVLVDGVRGARTRMWGTTPEGNGWRLPEGTAAEALGRAWPLASTTPAPAAAIEFTLTAINGDEYRRAVLVRE